MRQLWRRWYRHEVQGCAHAPISNECITKDGNFTSADNCCYYLANGGDYCTICSSATTSTTTAAAQACKNPNGVCCEDPVGVCGSSGAAGIGMKCRDVTHPPISNECITKDGNFTGADNCCYYLANGGDYCTLCSSATTTTTTPAAQACKNPNGVCCE